MIRWVWDAAKAAGNVRKHGVSFEIDVTAIDDPFSESVQDGHSDGDRWRTTGRPVASGYLVLVVIHTLPVLLNGALVGRIISAGPATRYERRLYEEGYPDPLPPHLETEWERLEANLDAPVDVSDIPEATGGSRGQRGRFARRRMQDVSVSLDADLVAFVERVERGGLDARLNLLLRDWVSRAREAAE